MSNSCETVLVKVLHETLKWAQDALCSAWELTLMSPEGSLEAKVHTLRNHIARGTSRVDLMLLRLRRIDLPQEAVQGLLDWKQELIALDQRVEKGLFSLEDPNGQDKSAGTCESSASRTEWRVQR